MTLFGQIVLGPPGSGKTTYCHATSLLLKDLGRKVALINLDPANELVPYTADVDINNLINVEDVMKTKNLGPNGALVYCMDFLLTNIDWLLNHLDALQGCYIIFDFPGQAELYAHHTMVQSILKHLEKRDVRLCSVYLVDSHYTNDAGKYISSLLLVLNSMLQMETPTVNVLSKVDSIEKYGSLEFGLDFYTEVLDLDFLVQSLDEDPLTKKYKSLNKAIADVVSDYSLVHFLPMSVENRHSLLAVLKAVDKANGYVFGGSEERNIQRLLSCAVGAEFDHDRIGHYRDLFTQDSDAEDDDEALKLLATQNVAH